MASKSKTRRIQIHIFPQDGGILVDKDGVQDHRSGTLTSHESQASDTLGPPVEVYRKLGKALPPSKIASRQIMKDGADDPGNDLSAIISLRASWYRLLHRQRRPRRRRAGAFIPDALRRHGIGRRRGDRRRPLPDFPPRGRGERRRRGPGVAGDARVTDAAVMAWVEAWGRYFAALLGLETLGPLPVFGVVAVLIGLGAAGIVYALWRVATWARRQFAQPAADVEVIGAQGPPAAGRGYFAAIGRHTLGQRPRA